MIHGLVRKNFVITHKRDRCLLYDVPAFFKSLGFSENKTLFQHSSISQYYGKMRRYFRLTVKSSCSCVMSLSVGLVVKVCAFQPRGWRLEVRGLKPHQPLGVLGGRVPQTLSFPQVPNLQSSGCVNLCSIVTIVGPFLLTTLARTQGSSGPSWSQKI